jgi:radical SAM protein with 4Fe4S-binding SPASM domain
MSIQLAKDIIDFLSECRIKNLFLIGGEPTRYSHLADAIRYSTGKGMTSTLISNGILLSDAQFADSLMNAGLTHVDISFKASSRDGYTVNTDVDAFERVKEAVVNLSGQKTSYSLSFVITESVDESQILEMCDIAHNHGSPIHFTLEFQSPHKIDPSTSADEVDRMKKIIGTFSNAYESVCHHTERRFTLHEIFPMCLWDGRILDDMRINGNLLTSCQLIENNGLVFNTKGEHILCNATDIPLGRFGEDFSDKKTFLEYRNSERISHIYRRFDALPDLACSDCSRVNDCKGGCRLNWLNLSFEQIKCVSQKERGTGMQ